MAMFGYMTDLDTVEVQKTEEVTAEGESQARKLQTHTRKVMGLDPFIVGMLSQSELHNEGAE